MDNQTVAVRTQQGEDLGSMAINTLIERLNTEIADRI
jgi:threonyl-tRNA synthetase